MNLWDAVGWIATAICIPGLVLAIRGGREKLPTASGFYAVGSAVAFFADVMQHSLTGAVINGSLCALFAYLWWKNRRKGRGRKVLKELGAKSRARVEALARQMTPSPIPAPGGAS